MLKRVFSTMKYLKSQLYSKVGDHWLNDHFLTFIKKDVFGTINNEVGYHNTIITGLFTF